MGLLANLIPLLPSAWKLIGISFAIWILIDVCRGVFRVFTSPFPGPRIAKFTVLYMRWQQLKGREFLHYHLLHQKYGPIVQLSPDEISFCHADALSQIYAGPRGLDAGDALSAFKSYGSENLVTTLDADRHAARRKMIIGHYSNSIAISPGVQAVFKKYIDTFMQIIEEKASSSPSRTVEISSWLRWLSADIILHQIYGESNHPNLLMSEASREDFKWLLMTALDFVLGPIALLITLFPKFATLLQAIDGPDKIGMYGMRQVEAALSDTSDKKEEITTHLKLLSSYLKKDGPTTLLPSKNYIASDCLDHFIAGYFSPADLFSALIWELSLPWNKVHQDKLRQELHEAGISTGAHPDILVLQKLPYLNNVLRELLRVHTPIPIGLPRKVKRGQNVVVLGAKIPPRTTIHAQAYSIHRDPQVFPSPDKWNPERWNIPTASPEFREMQKMFWPFGSGARMCSGMNIAWAELRLVTARIYSTYETKLDDIFLDTNGNLIPEFKRKDYYPSKLTEPIRFLEI
ncbi:hypothetical protein LOZ66_003348 [Ophidiomyces ophidiicola]|nr:hypothetical protein LOZ66_003348 [Ophidiomyces ophidiicola]